MCHGALGNKNNFATIGRALHQKTGRSVFSIDLARVSNQRFFDEKYRSGHPIKVNHGQARWSDRCSFDEMAVDIELAIRKLAQEKFDFILQRFWLL